VNKLILWNKCNHYIPEDISEKILLFAKSPELFIYEEKEMKKAIVREIKKVGKKIRTESLIEVPLEDSLSVEAFRHALDDSVNVVIDYIEKYPNNFQSFINACK